MSTATASLCAATPVTAERAAAVPRHLIIEIGRAHV